MPRANFGTQLNCSVETACHLCGAHDCDRRFMPSGMSFPRDNVPQYAGNGVWDSKGLSLSSAVGAMLGDPFQFAMTPEFDALRRLFQGDGATASARIENMKLRWTADRRYCGHRFSLRTRNTFFAGIRQLTAQYVKSRGLPERLPPTVRRWIEESMLREDLAQSSSNAPAPGWVVHRGVNCYEDRGAFEMDDEYFVVEDTRECYAECERELTCEGIVVDRQNTRRCYRRRGIQQHLCVHSGDYDLHIFLGISPPPPPAPLTPTPPPNPPPPPPAHISLEAATCAAVAVMDGIFASRTAKDLWVTELLDDRKSESDHSTFFNQLYASVSDLNQGEEDAHGVLYTTPYSFVAQGWYGGNETAVYAPGSGFDRRYMLNRACPPEPERGDDEDEETRWWCAQRRRYYEEDVLYDADTGEILTHGYKAPNEVEGFFVKPWRECGGNDHSALQSLNKPVDWAFFRAGSNDNEQHVIVLAPLLIPSTYGVDHFSFRLPQRFIAISERSPRGDYVPIAPGSSWYTLDRSVGAGRDVPAYGVLYRCAQSNLQSGVDPPVVGYSPSSAERSRLCAAARTLRLHANRIEGALLDATLQLELPAHIASELQSLRVAPRDAFVDLSAGIETETQSGAAMEHDSVCILTIAALRQLNATLRQRCGAEGEQ